MNTLNKALVKYVEENILPQYEKNDKGHGLSHIEYVTKRCFEFAKQFSDINIDLLYAIASFHDIAHHIDKAHHETLSADIFYKDEEMKRFFNEEERIIIKQAIEDHRASAESEPRSVYGKIISSADRSTDVEDFLKRTHAYTLKHFKGISEEEVVERGYTHTKEKYGATGYAKYYVEDEEYNAFRNKINEIINDRELFEAVYKRTNNIG